eukprot:5811517-Pleurochrysis_carterae.AAC.1
MDIAPASRSLRVLCTFETTCVTHFNQANLKVSSWRAGPRLTTWSGSAVHTVARSDLGRAVAEGEAVEVFDRVADLFTP